LGVFGQWDHDRGMFLVNYMTSSDPTRQYFGSQYVWILGENMLFRSP